MTPRLQSESLLVRPPTQEDVHALYTAIRESIAPVSRWLPWCHPDYREEETQQYVSDSIEAWSNRSRFPFLIVDQRSGELLGGVGLNHIDPMNGCSSLGYWVRSSRAGQGIATAAARLVAQFAFTEAALTRLEIVAHPQNLSSRRVAEKLGAKLECVARNRIVLHGKPSDAILYSLIPSDISEEQATKP